MAGSQRPKSKRRCWWSGRLLVLFVLIFAIAGCLQSQREQSENAVTPNGEVDLPPHTMDEVHAWLLTVPSPRRGFPPPENIDELRDRWVDRGKKIPFLEDALIVILRDSDADVGMKRLVTLAIQYLRSEKAMAALPAVFEFDDTALQIGAIDAIRTIGSSNGVKILAVGLESSYRPSKTPDKERTVPSGKAIVRANIVLALSEIGGDRAEELLERIRSREKDPYVLSGLNKIKPPVSSER